MIFRIRTYNKKHLRLARIKILTQIAGTVFLTLMIFPLMDVAVMGGNLSFKIQKEQKIPCHINMAGDYGWSWRDSNPRPNRETIRFLHAYSSLRFSSCGKTWTTNRSLIP